MGFRLALNGEICFALAILALFATPTRAVQPDSARVYRDLDCDGFDDNVVNSRITRIPVQFRTPTQISADSLRYRIDTTSITSASGDPTRLSTAGLSFAVRQAAVLDLYFEQLIRLPTVGFNSQLGNAQSQVCAGGVCTRR